MYVSQTDVISPFGRGQNRRPSSALLSEESLHHDRSRKHGNHHVFDQPHGAFLPSPRRPVASHPLPLTPPAHRQQHGAAAAQQQGDADGRRDQQGVSGRVPAGPRGLEVVLSAADSFLAFAAARGVVPPRAACGGVGVLLAALYAGQTRCGRWRAGGQLRGGGGGGGGGEEAELRVDAAALDEGGVVKPRATKAVEAVVRAWYPDAMRVSGEEDEGAVVVAGVEGCLVPGCVVVVVVVVVVV
ncbi:hypothetical protein EYF80_039950 [Liparis tanakae]|uniref:Uncharacterized protein n=1 Tax=Liparis tanakae TaxID=230148 RepID=A0A4Z2G8J5_9TELE|nr:hypothetical protein EYF80_039950 [Liparis tanakae]